MSWGMKLVENLGHFDFTLEHVNFSKLYLVILILFVMHFLLLSFVFQKNAPGHAQFAHLQITKPWKCAKCVRCQETVSYRLERDTGVTF